jgi:predicted Holliday junction resolvase-like endonuclease
MGKLHGNAWPEKKRIEVATAHVMGLSAPLIEAATGVDRQTIRHWRMEDWFKDLIEEIRREDDSQVDAKLTKLVGKSLDVLVDRLENGDFMFDPRQGQFVRKPVNARDVNRIADTMFDKRNLLRGKPTAISAKQEQITDRLAKLASEFERFVNAKDVTPIPTNHNEGSNGLLSPIRIEREESRGPVQIEEPSSEATPASGVLQTQESTGATGVQEEESLTFMAEQAVGVAVMPVVKHTVMG